MVEANLYNIPEEFGGIITTSFIWDRIDVEDDTLSGYPKDGSWDTEIPSRRRFFYSSSPLANQNDSIIFTTVKSEFQDTITQEDLLNCNEYKIQQLIYQIKMSIFIPDRGIIAGRLLDLHNYSKEEDPDCDGIAIESLRNFYGFYCKNLDIKLPAISLTPDNNIYASWRADKGMVFSIHFLANKDVRFVLFMPNDRHPDRKIRISGTVTSDIIMEKIAPYRIMEWISK